jgi:surface polysaccharide O-acyltransferase-like enzyme
MPEWLGWVATAVFTTSYFCKHAETLRWVQMLGALLWVVYGLASHARPVVAANLLVFTAAAVTTWRQRATI